MLDDCDSEGSLVVPERGEQGSHCAPETGDTSCDSDISHLLNTGTTPKQQDDLLSEMATLVEGEDRVGPPINEKLADTINALIRGKILPEKLEQKVKLYDKPKNCKNMTVTKVNPEIWAFLKPATRTRDAKWQKAQKYIMHSAVAITMAIDKLLSARNSKNEASIDLTELIKLLVDATAKLGSGNAILNYRKRDLLRPDLSPKYATLCSSQTEFTNYLFGDDLVQACKAIQETNKLGSKVQALDMSHRSRKRGQFRGMSHLSGDCSYRTRYQRGQLQFRTRGRRYQNRTKWASPTSEGPNAKPK